mmetsp:Transcript_29216/g.86496  ORF Transcript_29216/g.86496 Transcript_29216/m.86496 type:complete len:393 (-) Transcript_29216:131-1309(-)
MCYADSPSSSAGGAAKKFDGENILSEKLLRQRSRVESVLVAKEGRATAELRVKDGASSVSSKSEASASAHNEPFESHPFAYSIPFFILVAYGTKEFSLVFPYVLAPWAATRTYVHAGYHYDEDHTHFDNSAWTWGTDYAIAGLMLILAVRCLLARSGKSAEVDQASRTLRLRSAVLLAMYALSTLAGGYAHYTYHSIEAMNSLTFRILWTVCVGSVCAAGGVMGSIGTEVCRKFHVDARRKTGEVPFEIPVVPDGFWLCWGMYITVVCVRGGISYHRPACDIFIAGTTQFIPTAYCVSLMLVRKWREDGADIAPSRPAAHVLRPFRVMYYLGFVDNSILLPVYPLLVQYTDLSLGTINTLLHAWLTLSWGMQAIGLRHLCLAVDKGALEAEA